VLRHGLYTGIREPYSIQHSTAEFRDAQRRMTPSRLWRHRLRDNAAQQIEVDNVIQLPAKAGGSSGEKNWVLEGRSNSSTALTGAPALPAGRVCCPPGARPDEE
jgi:hypothetical protein